MINNPSIAVVFDLDDTLYKEIDFLKSAYSSIAYKISLEVEDDKEVILEKMLELYNSKQNAFKDILSIYDMTSLKVDNLLEYYRNHKPNIRLSPEVIEVLDKLKKKKIPLGLLTDGRSIQQRNKIEALKLKKYFSHFIISEEFGSEKPCIDNYTYFEKEFSKKEYVYIADNVKKDFITPNTLNWKTIKLIDNGYNIHKNEDTNFNQDYLANYNIKYFSELQSILFQ